MTFQSYPQHLHTDPHIYSMADLLQVKSGDLETILAQLVEDAVAHITQCQVGLSCYQVVNTSILLLYKRMKLLSVAPVFYGIIHEALLSRTWAEKRNCC